MFPFLVTCEAWSTHRDHDSFGVVVSVGVGVVRVSRIWFPSNNFWRDASISFKVYIRVKHHWIQVKFEIGVLRKPLTELWPFLLRFWLNCSFRSITFWRDATISFKFYRRVKHHKIQIKFEFRGHSQTLDCVMAFFDHCHIAYQMKCNHECSNMVANILPVDIQPLANIMTADYHTQPPLPWGCGQ